MQSCKVVLTVWAKVSLFKDLCVCALHDGMYVDVDLWTHCVSACMTRWKLQLKSFYQEVQTNYGRWGSLYRIRVHVCAVCAYQHCRQIIPKCNIRGTVNIFTGTSVCVCSDRRRCLGAAIEHGVNPPVYWFYAQYSIKVARKDTHCPTLSLSPPFSSLLSFSLVYISFLWQRGSGSFSVVPYIPGEKCMTTLCWSATK